MADQPGRPLMVPYHRRSFLTFPGENERHPKHIRCVAVEISASQVTCLAAYPIIGRMIEHVSVPISDYEKSKQFYLEALKPLDYVLGSDYPSEAAGFFEGGHTSFGS